MSSIFGTVSKSIRDKRARDANFNTDALHGSTHDIYAMDGSIANAEGDWGKGVYSSSSVNDVNANYAGEGPDLSNRLESRADEIVNDIDNIHTMADSRYNREHKKAMDQARSEIAGNSQGVVYPLKLNTDKFVTVAKNDSTMIEGSDYRADAELEIKRSDYDSDDDYQDAVSEYSFDLENSDYDSNISTVADTLRNAGVDSDGIQDVLSGFDGDSVSANDLDAAIRGLNFYPDPDDSIGSLGGLSSQVFKDLGFNGVIDKTVNDKFGDNRRSGQSMEGVDADTTHYIHFPGSENQIRSTNAQFDPDKKASNNLLAGGAAATVGAGSMFNSNPALAGTTPFDNTDMSALQLIPDTVTSLINDIYKYGKQAYTGEKDKGALLETPELEGDAKKINSSIGKVVDFALGWKGLMDAPSGYEMIEAATDAWQSTVRPTLVENIGEKKTVQVEGSALLASMILPVKGLPKVDRNADLLQRVGDVKSVNGMEVEYTPGGVLVPRQSLRAEDIIDRPFVSSMADTSRGDKEILQSIDGQEANTVMRGGQNFMRQADNYDQEKLWASEEKAVKALIAAAKQAEKLPGAKRSPLLLPYQMAGKSPDFATFSTDIMVPYAIQNMDASAKNALDKRIRDLRVSKKQKDGTTKVSYPMTDWVGIDHPEVMTYLNNAGGKRKNVLLALDEFRDYGSLNLSQVRAIITDPDQLAPRPGSLINAGVIDTKQSRSPSNHPTYNTNLPGSYLGTFDAPNSVFDLNPIKRSTNEAFTDLWGSKGYNLNAAKVPAPVQKAMQGGMIGVLDQRMVDELIQKGAVTP